MSKWDGYVPTPLRAGNCRRRYLRHGDVPAQMQARVDRSGGPDACWPWKGPVDEDGYGIVAHECRAHRRAYEDRHGVKLSAGVQVLHSCDNPPCCNPDHLRPGDNLANVSDRVERERSARGAGNGRAKLEPKEAIEIFNFQGTQSAAAELHGVSDRTVRDIQTGRTWGWLTSLTGRPLSKVLRALSKEKRT